MATICFKRETFSAYIFILICVIIFITFIIWTSFFNVKEHLDLYSSLSNKELIDKIKNLQDNLFDIKLKEQLCQTNLAQAQNNLVNVNVSDRNRFLDKIYNPLAAPENVIPSGTLTSRGYDSYQQYQMIGYLSGSGKQFPVFARDKYPGRSDKQEFYTIDESRGRVKIPFKTKNYNELFDGDSINIPEFGENFVFKKYENEGLRYDPNRI
jgi:hypothetical protein